jgi:hypothetical protein
VADRVDPEDQPTAKASEQNFGIDHHSHHRLTGERDDAPRCGLTSGYQDRRQAREGGGRLVHRLAADRATWPAARRKHPISRLPVFGSALTGAADRNSDIDLPVEFEDGRKDSSL